MILPPASRFTSEIANWRLLVPSGLNRIGALGGTGAEARLLVPQQSAVEEKPGVENLYDRSDGFGSGRCGPGIRANRGNARDADSSERDAASRHPGRRGARQ